MPWNLLILPLVAGYYLLTRSYLCKFRQQRLEQQRLIFESILLGILLAVVTYLFRLAVESWIPCGKEVIQNIHSYFPINTPYVGTSLATLGVALFFHGFNLILWRWKQIFVRRAIKEVGNEFENLMAAGSSTQLLQFTLTNGKFYIGWPGELPIPTLSNYVSIIPAFSGYRDKETHSIKFTTEYLSVYAQYIAEGKIRNIDELNVEIVISRDKIVTVSLFDLEMYNRFNPPVKPQPNSDTGKFQNESKKSTPPEESAENATPFVKAANRARTRKSPPPDNDTPV